MTAQRVLLVDHYDSFALLLAEQFACRAANVRCVRAPRTGEALAKCVREFGADLVVLSPGPGHPEQAAGTVEWLRSGPTVPVFGVCLGLQAMVVASGGTVGPAPVPVHGRASRVVLGDDPLFAGLPPTLAVGRYHSLVAKALPAVLVVTATVQCGEHELVMAVRHRQLPWCGVQFHPESVLTPHGGELCARVLAAAVHESPLPCPSSSRPAPSTADNHQPSTPFLR